MGPPPVVTGISPKEGPPGTRVTIRGEFLGTSAVDLFGNQFYCNFPGKLPEKLGTLILHHKIEFENGFTHYIMIIVIASLRPSF